MLRTALERIKEATEGKLWVDVDYDELPKADKPCPNCKQDTLHVDEGRFSTVHRCSNCGAEGIGPL